MPSAERIVGIDGIIIVENNDGAPGDPPPHRDFQDWLDSRWGDEHTTLQNMSRQLAGGVWLRNGAPQDGGTSQPFNQSEAERLLYEAYDCKDPNAVKEVLKLWEIISKTK